MMIITNKLRNIVWAFPLTIILLLCGCSDFLAEKSDKSLSIPATVDDFGAILNEWGIMNSSFASMGEASSDDFYLTDADYNGLYYESDKRLYSWAPDYVTRSESGAGHEWSICYKGIYAANSVLKGIDDFKLTGTAADNVRGQALVFRAARYLDGVQVWAPVYDPKTAGKDLGMVLRTDPDMTLPSVRGTVRQTYDLILDDLRRAIPLLPAHVNSPALPTKAAAYGLLARAYLIMGDYEMALQNAEEALVFPNQVIDFNDLDAEVAFPIPATNQTSAELVFFTRMFSSNIVNNLDIAIINKDLFDMYDEGDLRKIVFFKEDDDGQVLFKGTHMGHRGLITGITSSELLLIVAECQSRLGRLDKAGSAINQLKVKRWNKNKYTPYVFEDKNSALRSVLEERRKELIFRGLRWSDIKRLNRDGANISLTRTINGKPHVLGAQDKRFAIALPEDVLEITGIPQNLR